MLFFAGGIESGGIRIWERGYSTVVFVAGSGIVEGAFAEAGGEDRLITPILGHIARSDADPDGIPAHCSNGMDSVAESVLPTTR